MTQSYVIVGDGIAGSTAAETLREEDPAADITVITDEGEPLYNRILIKEHAKGKLPEAPVAIHDEDWYDERDIDLELNTLVVDLDTEADEVHTHSGDVYEYDQLLVATGGTPQDLRSFGIENTDAEGIHHFWTFQDARRIRKHAETAETGAVIGAGLLGIDLAAICGAQGVDAKYIMRGNRWWRYALSKEGAEIIHEQLRDVGVEPIFESGVERFETDDEGHVEATITVDDERVDSEFVGVAIGLDFNVEYLENTPLDADHSGVVVDEHMQTDVDNIYAAGDITRFYDVVLDQRTQNGAWGSAKNQGEVAAKNMAAGEPTEVFEFVPSYSITHFDVPFLSFGHPTEAEEYVERKYSEYEYRRVALKDGHVVGGVLIGDLSPQQTLKQVIREQHEVGDKAELLLEEDIDLEKVAPAQ